MRRRPDGSPFEYPPEAEAAVRFAVSVGSSRASCGLAERFPNEDPANLQRVALFYEIARSRHQLVDAVRNAVQVGKQPSPMLRALAELDFPLVITTNYDQLFENALAAAGKQPRVAVYTPNLEATTDYRDPTLAEPDPLQDPRRHLAPRDDRRHRRGLHPVRAADEQQGSLRPGPADAQVLPDGLDHAVRRLQPARLQPAAAVQDASLEDRQRQRARTCTRSTSTPTR